MTLSLIRVVSSVSLMRNLIRAGIAVALLTLTGCQAIGEALWNGIFPDSTRGTHREPGISQKERQARWEEENIRDTLQKFDRR